MANEGLLSIFRQGSLTYFYSSVFFPVEIRSEVSSLYAFVRTADDLVDCLPQDGEGFFALRDRFRAAASGGHTGDAVVDSFASLMRKKRFERRWVDSFLRSMEMDLEGREYRRLRDTEEYMYGSAEIIGLMMARILRLNDEAHPYARMLGRAMQYVNFIRDIQEDFSLGRCYFPKEDLEEHGLANLSPRTIREHGERFAAFIKVQALRYRSWQVEAEKGYDLIPRRYLVPIKTASDMYQWTASEILRDPQAVLKRKIKPSVAMILVCAGSNAISLWK